MDEYSLAGENGEAVESWIRAGLGFLLPLNDWIWWHHPNTIESMLIKALMTQKTAKWGGGKQLKSLDWLDARRKTLIAQAMKNVARWSYPPRVILRRELWIWAGLKELIALRTELSIILPDSLVLFDWPKARKPRRYFAHRTTEHKIVVSGTNDMRTAGEAMVAGLQHAEWSEKSWCADIVIAPAAEARNFSFADLFIIVDEDPVAVLVALDELRERGARCVMRVGADIAAITRWLEHYAEEWTYSSTQVAFFNASLSLGMSMEILASNTTFLDQNVEVMLPKNWRTDRARAVSLPPTAMYQATGSAEPPEVQLPRTAFYQATGSSGSPVVRETKAPAPDVRTDIPSARVLDATIHCKNERIFSFPKQGDIVIQVGIRYRSIFDDNRPVFPEHLVQWEGATKWLKVHMVSVGRDIVSSDLKLPQRGNSSIIPFNYVVRGAIDVRFIVSDGARIVQTSRLRGEPGGLVDFNVESANDSLEREKQPFDLALLVNSSLGNRPSATALTENDINITMLDDAEISNLRAKLLTAIELLVKHPAMQPDSTFYTLAAAGKLMLDALKNYIPTWPPELRRVQLTTQSNSYFPLEFFYSGRIPKNNQALLCPERASCLDSGVARNPCSIRDENKHLCPMGFLGVTAIIERQTWTAAMPRFPWLSAPQDFDSRNRITSLAAAAFAASRNADAFLDQDVAKGIPVVRLKDLADELGRLIEDWDDWETSVKANPTLLTLIPHVSDDHIYIGNNNGISFAAIDDAHVGFGHPVVIAMGCSSALGPAALSSLPSILLRKGAVVVIAALTAILGRHTNMMTLQIAQRLRTAVLAPNASTVGDVIQSVRRSMLASDLAIGLVVVAFGDADLKLGGD